jgi:hypothetical protein
MTRFSVLRCIEPAASLGFNVMRYLSWVDDVWGQNSCGPGCCSYLEHTSSTDCAFSFLSNSLPVFCLSF